MKKILITGSAGFIGQNLIEFIKKKEERYIIYTHDRRNGDLKLKKKFPLVDIVIHLAAFNSTKDFYRKSFDVIKDNIIPTLNLLDFFTSQKTKPLFVYFGTPEITVGATDFFNYSIPTNEKVPFVIENPKNLRWSYAGSKSLGEQAVIASKLNYIIIRPHNIYGPKQKNHFVPEFIERCKSGKLTLYGWKNTRSWLYIDDLCDAILKLLKCRKAVNEIINIGNNNEKRVIDVAQIILKTMNIRKKITKYDAPKGSAKRRVPCIKKIKKLIKWKPTTSLEDGIKKTILKDQNWYNKI